MNNYCYVLLATPYWQAGAQKQFYISKRCATKSQCDRTMKKYTASCTHVWYEDWKCAECCGGDKCNYFIIVSIFFLISWYFISISYLISGPTIAVS